MVRSFQASVIIGALAMALGARIRHKRRNDQPGSEFTLLTPPVTSGRKVGVVMNPGGFVKAELYVESMTRWQAEANKVGISLYVCVLSYWFNLPIPINTKKNVNNAIARMQDAGLPASANVYFTGHSMGGGAPLPIVQELFDEGVLSGMIIQAAYITRSFLPPVTDSFAFTPPTLTVGAELNYGLARLTRYAEAVYRQPSSTHPVVVIEGMNHKQYFSGGSFEDLKPEISTANAQQLQAKIVMDWMAKESSMGSGSFLASEVARTKKFVAPLIAAFELEGSRAFNVPNQVGTPSWECPRGVCPQGSQWIQEAQAYIVGKDVIASGVKLQNSFADLFPFAGGDREGRKPFITNNTVQAYVMASNTDGALGDRGGKDFTTDVSPFATGELLAKFVSRQNAGKTLLGRTLGEDTDLCQELNAEAYKYALANAGEKTRKRFEAHGQKLAFDATAYKGAGPLWVYGQMSWKEKNGQMHLQSTGLFTKVGDGAIDGNHYCKLLSRHAPWSGCTLTG
jgi:hypothetical protein